MLKIIKDNEIIISLRLQTQWDWTFIHISVGAAASREAGEVMGRRRRVTRLGGVWWMWRQSAGVVPPPTQVAADLTEQRPASPAVLTLPFVPHPSVQLHKPPPPAGVSVEGGGQRVERRLSRATLAPSTAVRYLEHISILCCCCCLCRLYLVFHSLIPASPLPPTPISPLSSSPSEASSDSRQNSLKWNCCRL